MATREQPLATFRLPGRLADHRITLYLLIPLLVSLLFTIMRAGVAALMPFPYALLVCALVVVVPWWTAQVLTAGAHYVLKPWSPPLWLLCLIGSLGQALLLSPYYRSVFEWGTGYWTRGSLVAPVPEVSLSWGYAMTLIGSIAPGAAFWIAVNYFYDRVLDVPRFRYARPGAEAARAPEPAHDSTLQAPSHAAPVPKFLLRSDRLTPAASVFAVTAEEHYIRVITDQGTDLIRYRFADALGEMATQPDGMQVHRSWWIRIDRIASYRERGKSIELTLCEGTVVPVSLAFREAVQQRLPADLRRSQ